MDVDVLAIYPHAHYLGKVLEGYATLPGGKREWLIRIPDWDSNWQAVYRYKKPVFLPAGTLVSMRYHYDNSAANPRNPKQPPRRVRAGNNATDEMGHLWLQLLPRDRRDRSPRVGGGLRRSIACRKHPDDYAVYLDLGESQAFAPRFTGRCIRRRDSCTHRPPSNRRDTTYSESRIHASRPRQRLFSNSRRRSRLDPLAT